MVLTALEVIGFIATRPRGSDKNGFFVQSICHMQQIFRGRSGLRSVSPHSASGAERLVIGTLHSKPGSGCGGFLPLSTPAKAFSGSFS